MSQRGIPGAGLRRCPHRQACGGVIDRDARPADAGLPVTYFRADGNPTVHSFVRWRSVCLIPPRSDYEPGRKPGRFTGEVKGWAGRQDKGTPRDPVEVLPKAILSSFAGIGLTCSGGGRGAPGGGVRVARSGSAGAFAGGGGQERNGFKRAQSSWNDPPYGRKWAS